MANNDKLKEIISNLQNIIDLAVSMKDSELYPVSFFSNAFDLLQKVQGGFHALETEQVEMFALQMKKHQDLITSIHQQMRYIENVPEPRTFYQMPKPEPVPEPEPQQVRQPIKDYIIPQNIDDEIVETESAKAEKPKKTKPVEIGLTETKPQETPENSISHPPLSLNDVIEKNKLSDLRKAFSLNDRFRYQRELFGSKEDVMDKVITELNSHHSLNESLTYLEGKLGWDFSSLTVMDFIKKLEIRFL